MADVFGLGPKISGALDSAGIDSVSAGQSAASLAATRVASRFSPKVLSEAGRAVGGIQAVREFLGGGEYLNTPTPLLGGITLQQARQMYKRMNNVRYARKNFFYITVESANKNPPPAPILTGNISPDSTGTFLGANVNVSDRLPIPEISLFATELSYSPTSISGDARRFGSAMMDDIQSCERTELRITTLDDVSGSIKTWFRMCARRVANPVKGTYGLPFDYALYITIYHAVVQGYDENESHDNVYSDSYLMRPTSLECDLSRRDGGLQELQMVFTQMDTFMSPKRG